MVTSGGEWGEGIVREFGTDMVIHLKWITSKDLLYSTGNSAQHYVITLLEKESEREFKKKSKVKYKMK